MEVQRAVFFGPFMQWYKRYAFVVAKAHLYCFEAVQHPTKNDLMTVLLFLPEILHLQLFVLISTSTKRHSIILSWDSILFSCKWLDRGSFNSGATVIAGEWPMFETRMLFYDA